MEGGGGGGGGGGSFNFMGFGDTSGSSNGGLSTMMMRMPLMTTSSSSPHPHLPPPVQPQPQTSNMNTDDHDTNTLFLPLPCSTSTHHNNNNNQHMTTVGAGAGVGVGVGVGHNYFNNNENSSSCSSVSTIRAKIMAHPHYSRLLTAYVNCQKVGAPPEVVARLEEACASGEAAMRSSRSSTSCVGEDPALDQFMEAYCEMLSKYEQELTKPFKEAMLFLSRIECQFKALTVTSPSDNSVSRGGSTSKPLLHFDSGEVKDNTACGEALNRNGSSDEDVDASETYIDPQAEDRELKGQLLRKYSGYLGSLKQEFLKKRKKGKLPKEARQQLLDWWSRHYKWPYPSESQKLALAESTGLDQKQINNWFINQRKRHWKPSEEMQFVVMDAGHQHYYMDNVLGNPFPMDCTPTLL